MTEIRFFTDKIYALVVIAGVAGFLSFNLNGSISRLAEPPTDLLGLASHQLGAAVLMIAAGGTLSAVVTSRHARRVGRDYWVTATKSPLSRCLALFISVAIPVLCAWLIFIVATSLQLGSRQKFPIATAIIFMSMFAVLTGVALGQLIGFVLPPIIAAPAAFVLSYAFAVFPAAAGDDSWWQWLGPGFGDDISHAPKYLWLSGEFIWFAGLSLSLILVASFISSRPQRIPRRWIALSVTLLIVGLIMLRLNGTDASTDALVALA